MSVDKDQLSRPELKKLIPVYEDFINAQGLTIINNKFTHFQSNCDPSFIDNILSNKPNHIDQVQTTPGLISDYMIISCLFHVNELQDNARF